MKNIHVALVNTNSQVTILSQFHFVAKMPAAIETVVNGDSHLHTALLLTAQEKKWCRMKM
jgi:hypothetical protein